MEVSNHDSGVTRVEALLNSLTLIGIVISLVALVSTMLGGTAPTVNYVAIVSALFWASITRLILLNGFPRLAAILYLTGFFVLLSLLAAVTGGLRCATYSALIINVLLSVFMLGHRAALAYMLVFVATSIGFCVAATRGWLPDPVQQRPYEYLIGNLGSVLVGTVFIMYVMRHIQQSVADVQRSEEQFRRMFELASVGMTTVNLDGTFQCVNPAFCDTLGYQANEMTGRHILDVTHPDDLQTSKDSVEQVVRGEIPSLVLEKRYIRRDGSICDASTCISLIRDAEGQPHQLLAQVIDLTDFKRTEAALRQTQKLESLGIMAGGVAHDFNNLLTSMLAQASILETTIPANSYAQQNVRSIVRAAERAANLAHQMLIYAGNEQVAFTPICFNQLIRDSFQLLDASSPKDIQLKHFLQESLPRVEGDPGQLQQVVTNLIINSTEAVKRRQRRANNGDFQGFVSIETSVVTVNDNRPRFPGVSESLEPGEYVAFSVIDNGMGMDEVTESKIFDPFFTTKHSGRGLGLAAVIGIIRGHHGGLQLESAVGKGTNFKVLLPISRATMKEPTPTPPLSMDELQDKAILVIDDEESIRNTLQTILETFGARMFMARDGQEGIETYRQLQAEVDLIILDLSMPGMTGEETFARLRSIDAEVPILVSSGYNKTASDGGLQLDQFSGFLLKPYRFETLTESVLEHIALRPRQKPGPALVEDAPKNQYQR